MKAIWEKISPMHNIDENSPPTLLLNGTADKIVPVAEIEEYERRMSEAGRRCEVVLYQGQGHSFFNYNNKKYYNKTVSEMDAFLVSLEFLD
ncbi:MAG: alpha/beta hydrolase [Verrucomicrobiales bacterium]